MFVVQTSLINDYTFIKQIGEGNSAKVYLAQRKNQKGELVAIKIMNINNFKTNTWFFEDLENEIRVHWNLKDCEGALQLREIYE